MYKHGPVTLNLGYVHARVNTGDVQTCPGCQFQWTGWRGGISVGF